VRRDPVSITNLVSIGVGAPKRSSTAGAGRGNGLRAIPPGGIRSYLKVESDINQLLNREEGWRNPYPAESEAV
jgi:hypothetical protein